MVRHWLSTYLAAALRSKAFSFENASSVGVEVQGMGRQRHQADCATRQMLAGTSSAAAPCYPVPSRTMTAWTSAGRGLGEVDEEFMVPSSFTSAASLFEVPSYGHLE